MVTVQGEDLQIVRRQKESENELGVASRSPFRVVVILPGGRLQSHSLHEHFYCYVGEA